MIDVVFNLKGHLVPEGYIFELWNEVVRNLPWLESIDRVGILPLRGSESAEGLLLPRRCKFVLRLPKEFAADSMAISGCELRVGTGVLKLDSPTIRKLQPYTTLHAQLVEGVEEEELFLLDIANQLQISGITCKWICGKWRTVKGFGKLLKGFSLVLHDLKIEESLTIQAAGLGGNRKYGCGIFVPYREISGLN